MNKSLSHTYSIKRVDYKGGMRDVQEFVDAHHSYIRFSDRPSRKMYYLLYEDGQLIGVFGLGSAFAKPKPIAEYMKKNGVAFNEMANNTVFCLHGHKSKNAGSKLLSMVRKDAVQWWKERYGDDLKVFQTFILPPRTGAVYKADNWIQLGSTTGGKSLITRTIKKSDYEAHPERYQHVEIRTFKNGETRYIFREFITTEPKLIFVKPTHLIERRNVHARGLLEVSPRTNRSSEAVSR